jgi:hypothetical protein
MADQVVSKDAYLVQKIGGSTKYGNGDGTLTIVGRVPSGDGTNDWKTRSVYEIPLRGGGVGILDGLSTVSASDFELTVAGATCLIGGRGAQFYAFLEEITTDFVEKAAAGDCAFGSGTGNGVWGADSGAITTNRVFKSSPGLNTGDKVSFNNTAMMQAWLADTSKTVARVRVIFANSAGTTYDETAGAVRGTAFYSLQHATAGNRPVQHVTGSGGAVAKGDSDTITIDEQQTKTELSTTPSDSDTITIIESEAAGPVPTWYTEADETGAGVGKVVLPASNLFTSALLTGVSEEDVVIQSKFSINKIPSTQSVIWWHVARVQEPTLSNFYGLLASCKNIGGNAGISINMVKEVGGIITIIGTIISLRALLVGTDYWLKFIVFGTSPTTIAGKLWRDDENEPDGYQVTGQDSEAVLQVAGQVGLRASTANVGNLPITFTFDDFTVVAP